MAARPSFRAIYADVVRPLGVAILSRLLWWPLTLFVPRSSERLVVIGRENGKFLDNAKHFYANLRSNSLFSGRVTFLTARRDVFELLLSVQADVLFYPGWRSQWALLRARYIVVDSMDYVEQGRLGLIRGADVVQIWHGAPLKHIELSLHRRRLDRLSPLKRLVINVSKQLTGRFGRPSLLVSTSEFFTTHVFSLCMRARSTANVGYPRNDVLYDPKWMNRALMGLNVDMHAFHQMSRHRNTGAKVIAYTPTFRGNAKGNEARLNLDFPALNQYCRERNLLFAIKPHPVMAVTSNTRDYDRVLMVDPNSDFYPLMPQIDILVTDYSSIYFDYLHLDRPIVFYAYDLDEYLSDDRPLYFDYEEVTPGRKALTFAELLDLIDAELADVDDQFGLARKRVRAMVFDQLDGRATERLTEAMYSLRC